LNTFIGLLQYYNNGLINTKQKGEEKVVSIAGIADIADIGKQNLNRRTRRNHGGKQRIGKQELGPSGDRAIRKSPGSP
jgi:hypothetical protein